MLKTSNISKLYRNTLIRIRNTLISILAQFIDYSTIIRNRYELFSPLCGSLVSNYEYRVESRVLRPRQVVTVIAFEPVSRRWWWFIPVAITNVMTHSVVPSSTPRFVPRKTGVRTIITKGYLRLYRLSQSSKCIGCSICTDIISTSYLYVVRWFIKMIFLTKNLRVTKCSNLLFIFHRLIRLIWN